jgi:phospholipid/cholesterol/gamma-HCH transport system substrate-binding protein
MRRLARVVATVAAGTLLLSGCEFDGAYDLPLPGSPVDEDHSYEVTAEFADILNVVPRSPVMVDDVVVGEVIEVDRAGWHAQVTLRVRDDVELPDNAIADIRQVSLLGEKYIALEAPEEGASERQLGDGDEIPLSATGRNPEVEEVLGALSFLLSGGGVAQLGTIVEELNNVLSGREERLRSLLGSLEDVVGTLDAQKGDIIRALEAMNNLTATLNAEKETITQALDATAPAIKVLADQEAELVDMLGALDRLGVVGTRVIRASKKDLIKTLEHLRPVVSKLSAAGDELAPGLNLLVSFPFPDEASDVVKGDYANTSIRAEISLDNFLTGGGGEIPPIIPPSACRAATSPASRARRSSRTSTCSPSSRSSARRTSTRPTRSAPSSTRCPTCPSTSCRTSSTTSSTTSSGVR